MLSDNDSISRTVDAIDVEPLILSAQTVQIIIIYQFS